MRVKEYHSSRQFHNQKALIHRSSHLAVLILSIYSNKKIHKDVDTQHYRSQKKELSCKSDVIETVFHHTEHTVLFSC